VHAAAAVVVQSVGHQRPDAAAAEGLVVTAAGEEPPASQHSSSDFHPSCAAGCDRGTESESEKSETESESDCGDDGWSFCSDDDVDDRDCGFCFDSSSSGCCALSSSSSSSGKNPSCCCETSVGESARPRTLILMSPLPLRPPAQEFVVRKRGEPQ
jgi:hypothetical protein